MFKNVCVNVPEKISVTKHQCVRHSTPLSFCLWYSPLKDSWSIPWSSYKKLAWEKLQPISTHIHSIPFRRSNWLNYQAMSTTCNQSQLCKATLISSFCPVSDFILAITFVSRHVYFNQTFNLCFCFFSYILLSHIECIFIDLHFSIFIV